MALYEKQFTKPYPGGYIDKPVMTTPVTAEILNKLDAVLTALEDFLTSSEVGFANALTVGARGSGDVGEGSIATKNCIASGKSSQALGFYNTASGDYASAEGVLNKVSGNASHGEGNNVTVSGARSHGEGNNTITSGNDQHVQGKFNVEDTEGVYAHIVGGGTSAAARKNIHTLDWQGNAFFAGDVTNGNGVSLDGLMALIGTTGQLRTIVTELPTEDISTETIYMVLKEAGGENDIYNEYINVDGTVNGWEFIGNSAVDLTGYYTAAQVDNLLAGYVASVSGMGLSSNDYTAEDQALVESIRNMTAADALAILNGEVA